MFVHWDLRANLFLESQGHGVGFHVLVLRTALQVGIVVAPAPPQAVAVSVKPEARHEDEIQSPCGKEEHRDGSEWFLKEMDCFEIWVLFFNDIYFFSDI